MLVQHLTGSTLYFRALPIKTFPAHARERPSAPVLGLLRLSVLRGLAQLWRQKAVAGRVAHT